jgi:hypothetical protein
MLPEGVVQVGICAGGISFSKGYPHQQDGDVEDHPGYLTRRHTEQCLRPLDHHYVASSSSFNNSLVTHSKR